jgi:hypothetical protein
MRVLDVFGCIVLLILFGELAISCNYVIGVEDVSLSDPDGVAECQINRVFERIVSDATTTLSIDLDGSTHLQFLLNNDSQPDYLDVRLYNNMGGHGVLAMVSADPFQLTEADAKHQTCGICANVSVNFDTGASIISQVFWARAQGDLIFTTVDSTQLIGSMHKLQFRRVTTTDPTMDVDDNCPITISDLEFSVMYLKAETL